MGMHVRPLEGMPGNCGGGVGVRLPPLEDGERHLCVVFVERTGGEWYQ